MRCSHHLGRSIAEETILLYFRSQHHEQMGASFCRVSAMLCGNQHPSATPVLLIFSVRPGPKVMEKIAFSLPLQDLLCPCRARPEAFNWCPDLSHRLPEQSDRLMAPVPVLPCPGAPPIWDRLQAGELFWELPGFFFFWLICLVRPTACPESLMFSSPPVLCVLMERCSPQNRQRDGIMFVSCLTDGCYTPGCLLCKAVRSILGNIAVLGCKATGCWVWDKILTCWLYLYGSGWEFLCSILWCGPVLWVSTAHTALKPSCFGCAYPGALPLQKNVGRGRRREGGMNLLDGITQGLSLVVHLPSFISTEFRELVVFVSVIQWQLSRLLPGGFSFLWNRQEMTYWCRNTNWAAFVADFSLWNGR